MYKTYLVLLNYIILNNRTIKKYNNFKLKLLLVVISLLVIFPSFAQKFIAGSIVGFTTSQIDRDTQKGYKKLGALAGVFVKTHFSDITGAKIELNYTTKGATKIINKIEEFKTHLNYVEMPILFTFKVLDNFEVNLGISPAYLISSKLYQDGYEEPESKYDLYNYDFSGLGSVFYYFSDKIALNIRFSYSIVPINDTPGWLNSNFSFALVYNFN